MEIVESVIELFIRSLPASELLRAGSNSLSDPRTIGKETEQKKQLEFARKKLSSLRNTGRGELQVADQHIVQLGWPPNTGLYSCSECYITQSAWFEVPRHTTRASEKEECFEHY